MGKGPEAFRTISEVAADLDVEKHVLRFWETKFTQVKPMKRGGGRRYYRPEDVELLRGIRTLLYDEGYTIRGLQRVFRQHGVNYIKSYKRAERTGAAGRTSSPGIPDVAGEAAGHARKSALQRTQPAGTREKGKSGGQSSTAPKPPALAAAQRRVLEGALAELEACRDLLVSARE